MNGGVQNMELRDQKVLPQEWEQFAGVKKKKKTIQDVGEGAGYLKTEGL